MQAEISVIVPVYNVEKTLDRCLESILCQTFQDFEIILVDDGSTDGSGSICDRYAAEYPQISVIHKENEGLGPTRNVGIRAAEGKYIYHCDSDDWLKPELLEKVHGAIVDNDADVAVFGYDLFTEKDGEIIPYSQTVLADGVYAGGKEIKKLFSKEYFNSFVVLSACNRMYKKSFITDNGIYFPSLRRCQDMAYSMLLFDKIEKLVTIHDTYYCYIIQPGVYKGRSYSEMIDIYCTIYSMSAEYFEKWGLFDEELKQKLNSDICEKIANYSAYAWIVKYADREKENICCLLENETVTRMFATYQNSKKSRFMLLFSMGVRQKMKHLLHITAKLVIRKQHLV